MSNFAKAAALVNNWTADWGTLSLGGDGARKDLIDRITNALSPPVPPGLRNDPNSPPPPVERYCVIGVDAYQRTWFPTLDGAVAHAGELFEEESNGKIKLMLAVKAEAVVERTPPPPIRSRKPVEIDFDKSRRRQRGSWE